MDWGVRNGFGRTGVLRAVVGSPDRWGRLFGWTTLAGILCGLIGPYGSFPANSATRLFYWTALFWIGTLLLWPVVTGALLIAQRRAIPILLAGTAAALIACIPLATIGAFGAHLFWPVHASGIRVLEWYVQTVIIALPATGLAVWLEQPFAPSRASRLITPQPASITSAGEAVLPDHLLDLTLCLQMEDHHVRVHMMGHSLLHLAPMREAVEALGEERGLQVHRSWWVAERAVAGWSEEGRSMVLVLINGLRVPVARNRVAHLRMRGWLRARENA